jgi:DNA topoisomerase IB
MDDELPPDDADCPTPAEAAALAGLSYVDTNAPGFRRLRKGAGFAYVDGSGDRIAEGAALARIRSLVIPPAWTEVWICPSPRGHIQATGRDARGRKQYRYHPDWADAREEAKFDRLAEFAALLPVIRERTEADMARRGLSREKVVATVVWLLDATLIRIGNDEYRRQNRSFGLTTLRDHHVGFNGSEMRFSFTGKSGKSWNLRLRDRRAARIVRSCQELPGQHLFQYLDEVGTRRAIGSQDVNAYIAEHLGPAWTQGQRRPRPGRRPPRQHPRHRPPLLRAPRRHRSLPGRLPRPPAGAGRAGRRGPFAGGSAGPRLPEVQPGGLGAGIRVCIVFCTTTPAERRAPWQPDTADKR